MIGRANPAVVRREYRDPVSVAGQVPHKLRYSLHTAATQRWKGIGYNQDMTQVSSFRGYHEKGTGNVNSFLSYTPSTLPFRLRGNVREKTIPSIRNFRKSAPNKVLAQNLTFLSTSTRGMV